MPGRSKNFEALRDFCEHTPVVDCHDHTAVRRPKYEGPITVIRQDYLGLDEAKSVARAWLFDNPNEFFRLGL